MQHCLFRTVRFCMWVWLKVKHNCNACKRRAGYEYIHEDMPSLPLLTLTKVIHTRENGDSDFKYMLDWVSDDQKFTPPDELFHHVMPPWLLITKNDEDFTEALHPYIAKGNIVNLHFLNKRFGEGAWKIVNPKTFEEEDFPSSGITIK